ncbi:hypothetical protein [Sutcliffiella rhizosphaerae]|uniref:DUF350 domain-containing protein n=1 Tax=Sutcliffiella rhizosphaerae TaxID=2880967 RepID=A0ABN8A797_9BACI|nr:hypothetical protein [Sutcliffiella rhizosphaerae]CAG9620894.1 hypothetical protein BACCIP111883_01665 [Sutcliffiella rhizosphaerae]
MDLVKNTAFFVALIASLGMFLLAYFEALKITNQEGKVKGGNMILGFSLAVFFALMANVLM